MVIAIAEERQRTKLCVDMIMIYHGRSSLFVFRMHKANNIRRV